MLQKTFKPLYSIVAICDINITPFSSALSIVTLPLIEDIFHLLETSDDLTMADFNTKRK